MSAARKATSAFVCSLYCSAAILGTLLDVQRAYALDPNAPAVNETPEQAAARLKAEAWKKAHPGQTPPKAASPAAPAQPPAAQPPKAVTTPPAAPPAAKPAAAPPSPPPAAKPAAAPPSPPPTAKSVAAPPPAPPAAKSVDAPPVTPPAANSAATPAAPDANRVRPRGLRPPGGQPPPAGNAAVPAAKPAAAAPAAAAPPPAASPPAPAAAAPAAAPPAGAPQNSQAYGGASQKSQAYGGAPQTNQGLPAANAPKPVIVNTPATEPAPAKLQALKDARTTTTVPTGRPGHPGAAQTVIKEPDNRTIIKQGGKAVIQHDESKRLARSAPNAVVNQQPNGNNVTVINSVNNTQVVNVTDPNGNLLRRYRKGADGNEVNLIDNTPSRRNSHFGRNLAIGAGIGLGVVAGAMLLNSVREVHEPRHELPPERYRVRYDGASDEELYETLSAPPVARLQRAYTLDEVRSTYHLRQHMRSVDLDDINFEFGSWEVDPSQYRTLERMARAMQRVIDRNPNEVFMIEGYTDAVGSQEDNLTLSDRRAESVAEVLTKEFNVPPENLTTQGYGEEYLKIETSGPERANRRVAVRNITPLITRTQESERRDNDRRDYGRDNERRYERYRR